MKLIKKILMLVFVIENLSCAMEIETGKITGKKRREPDQSSVEIEIEPEIEKSSFEKLPNEIKERILNYLVTSPGATGEMKLYNAVNNIRNFMTQSKSFIQFLDDSDVNGYLIRELNRYTGGDYVKAAAALATKGAAQWLKQIGPHINEKFTYNNFFSAVESGDTGKLNFLLRTIPGNIQGLKRKTNSEGITPLQIAADLGNSKMISLLLPYFKEQINDVFDYTYTPLVTAVGQNRLDIVEKLINAGAEVNIPENEPLIVLAKNKNSSIEIAKKLIEAGARINPSADDDFNSALWYAIDTENIPLIKLLLKHGANPNGVQNGFPLIFAVSKGNADIVEILLNSGADINQPDSGNGETALMCAVALANEEIVELLLKRYAQVNKKNEKDDETALTIAEKFLTTPNKNKILNLLLKYSRGY